MAKLELKKQNHQVNVYGKDLELKEPTYRESNEYSKSLKDKNEDEQGDLLLDFLAKCGLPREVSEDMTSSDILAVCDMLMPSKKK